MHRIAATAQAIPRIFRASKIGGREALPPRGIIGFDVTDGKSRGEPLASGLEEDVEVSAVSAESLVAGEQEVTSDKRTIRLLCAAAKAGGIFFAEEDVFRFLLIVGFDDQSVVLPFQNTVTRFFDVAENVGVTVNPACDQSLDDSTIHRFGKRASRLRLARKNERSKPGLFIIEIWPAKYSMPHTIKRAEHRLVVFMIVEPNGPSAAELNLDEDAMKFALLRGQMGNPQRWHKVFWRKAAEHQLCMSFAEGDHMGTEFLWRNRIGDYNAVVDGSVTYHGASGC